MTYVVTRYDCASYLRRCGFLIDGDPRRPGRSVTVDAIKQAVSQRFELPLRIMSDSSRFRAHARPRQIAMYLCRHLTVQSLPELGRLFGWRDHTTVIHAIKRIEKLRAEDPDLDRTVSELMAGLER
jgi:chromosomal replication initiator protein